MNLVKFLVGLGSRSYVLSVLLTSIVVGASECGTVPCEGDTCETGGGGSAGEGGDGGDGGAGGETVVGGGGSGGEAGQGGAGGATTTSETDGGGSGGSTTSSTTNTGSGGGLPAGCDAPAQSDGADGANCALATCGEIDGFFAGSTVCNGTCTDESIVVGLGSGVPQDMVVVFDDFSQQPGCDTCQWSYVVRVVAPGGGGCVKATASDGLLVESIYDHTVCGTPSEKQCVVAQPVAGPIGGQLRIVVTVDPDNVPDVAWFRVERTVDECPAAGYTCN